LDRFGFTCQSCANARSTVAFKALLLSFLIATVGMFKVAHAGLLVSVTGPDGAAQVISASRFAAWRWGIGSVHLDVSVFARLAAISADVPFDGTAYLTTGVGPGISSANEIAHSVFHVTSQVPSFVELFHGLTLQPSEYWLTVTGSIPQGGIWVAAWPIAFIFTSDAIIGGGAGIADGQNASSSYPPSSVFVSSIDPTSLQFIVTDLGSPPTGIPEPSSVVLVMAGVIAILFAGIGRRERRASGPHGYSGQIDLQPA